MAYTPPPSGGAVFIFKAVYTPPASGSGVWQFVPSTQSILPVGFSAGGMGTPSIRNASETIAPVGYQATLYGTAAVIQSQYVYPEGTELLGVGTPAIRLQYRFVSPTGIAPGAFGTAKLNRTVLPVGTEHTACGTPNVASGYAIYPPSIDDGALGTPTTQRKLLPVGFTQESFGTPLTYSTKFDQIVFMEGEEYAAYGTPRVVVSEFQCIPVGAFNPFVGDGPIGTVGTPGVANAGRGITPAGFVAVTFGVGGLTSTSGAPADSVAAPAGIVAGSFGTAQAKNRNQTLAPQGIASGEVGTREATEDNITIGSWNVVDKTTNIPVSHHTWREDHTYYYIHGTTRTYAGQVTYNSPPYPPAGYDSETQYVVYQNFGGPIYTEYGLKTNLGVAPALLQIVRPVGSDTKLFGTTKFSPTQYVDAQGSDNSSFGTSFARRYGDLYAAGIAPPDVVAPVVHGENYIYAHEICPYRVFSNTDVRNDPSRFAANVTVGFTGSFGTTQVENKTRYIAPPGFLPTSFGNSAVTHGVRFVLPVGTNLAAYGVPLIGYDQTVAPIGTMFTRFGDPFVHGSEQYVAPTGFTGAVGAPSIVNLNRTIFPEGSDTAVYGTQAVENYNRILYPDGFYQGVVPNPSVEQEQFISIQTSGFDTVTFGTTSLYNKTQIVAPEAIEPGLIGQFLTVEFDTFGKVYPSGMFLTLFGTTTRVSLSTNYVNPPSIVGAFGVPDITRGVRYLQPDTFITTAFGTALLTGGTQFVAPAGIGAGGIGAHFVADGVRYVDEHSRDHAAFGFPVVGTDRYILTVGFAGEFGTPDVLDNSQRILAPSISAPGFGDAQISLYTRVVSPLSIQQPVEDVTTMRVYNSRQIASQYFEVTPSDGGVFGQYTLIENRNKTIAAYGLSFTKYGTATLQNTARLLEAVGFDALQSDRQDVSHFIRTIYPLGDDFLVPPTRYQAIYNSARVLAQNGGIKQDAYGLPNVESNLQTISRAGDIHEEFGTAYADYAIRTLAPYYTYEGTFGQDHRVSLGQQYVDLNGRGIQPKEVGAHDLQIHFTIFYPVQLNSLKMGEPTVVNRNRVVREYGYDHTEWGRPTVYNLTQYLRPQGFDAFRSGIEGSIGPNIKYIYPPGINRMVFGNHVQVYLANPYLPFTQTISDAGGYPNDSFEEQGRFPRPSVRGNVIYAEGFIATRYGQGAVHANSIFPKGFYGTGEISNMGQFGFGTPSLNGPQFIYLSNVELREGFGNQYFPTDGDGKGIAPPEMTLQRIDPHTIWCTYDVTQQAIDNHGGKQWRAMDSTDDNYGDDRPKFGIAGVTLQNRRITQNNAPLTSDYGVPSVANRIQYVAPDGIKAFKTGFANLNDGKTVKPVGRDAALYGNPTLTHYEAPGTPKTLRPQGFIALGNTSPRVSNFYQYVAPIGITSPLGIPRVHPPEPIVVQGFDASRFGALVTGNKIRTLFPEGYETLDFDFTFGNFNDRMRVRVRGHGANVTMGDQLKMGVPHIGDRYSRVYARGFDMSAYSPASVYSANFISVAGYGFDACTFGDVDRWEAGKIKPHGDEMLLTGIPKTQRVMHVVGEDKSLFGSTRMGSILAPTGFEDDAFEVPAATHEDNGHVCGTMVRAIPAPGGAYGAFGTPGVVQ